MAWKYCWSAYCGEWQELEASEETYLKLARSDHAKIKNLISGLQRPAKAQYAIDARRDIEPFGSEEAGAGAATQNQVL